MPNPPVDASMPRVYAAQTAAGEAVFVVVDGRVIAAAPAVAGWTLDRPMEQVLATAARFGVEIALYGERVERVPVSA